VTVQSRRALGTTLVAVGVVSVLLSVVALVVGQQLVGRFKKNVDDSLALTQQALDAVQDSIATTGSIVETVRTGVDDVSASVASVKSTVDQTSTVISNSNAFLGTSLPQTLDAINNVLPTIELAAGSIDDALRFASKAPFGPNYNPAKPFDEAVGQLADALAPLPDQLRSFAGDFAGLSPASTALAGSLTTLSTDLGTLGTQLDQVSQLVDRYASTAAAARIIADRSRDELGTTATMARLLLAVVTVLFGLSQILPIWFGTQLRNAAATVVITSSPPSPVDDVAADADAVAPGTIDA